MIRVLLRKELRELRPYLALAVVILAVDVLSIALQNPDGRTLETSFSELDELSPLVFLLAFAVGTGISNRERDERTLSFIDGLPLGRSGLFVAKLAAALAVLMAIPFLRAVLFGLLHLWARGELDHAVHPQLLAMSVALSGVMLAVGLTLGAALGLLRSLSWAALGVLAAALAVVRAEVPQAELLNPLALPEPNLWGVRWDLDPAALWFHLAAAVVLGLVAWWGFLRAGLPPKGSDGRRPVVSAAITVATVASLGGALAIWVGVQDDETGVGNREDGPWFAPSPPAQALTTHYRFSYPAHQAAGAVALADEADATFERVHALFGAPLGEPVEADLSGSMQNTSGTAFFGRLRMRLGREDVAVLAHETAHVVTGRLAGAERATLWDRATVLDEGLATWVERSFQPPEAKDEHRFVLAAMHRRRTLRLEEVYAFEEFARRWDQDLKYPIGEALVNAMVKVYGPEAPGRLVRAFAEPRLPQDLQGQVLWNTAFQVAGMDLGRVVDAFFLQANRDATRFAADVDALPRPVPTLLRWERLVGVQVELDEPLPDGWQPRLRFRPGSDSGPDEYSEVTADPDEPVWRTLSQTRRGQVCVQAGLQRDRTTLYEEWTCLPIAGAEEWSPPE